MKQRDLTVTRLELESLRRGLVGAAQSIDNAIVRVVGLQERLGKDDARELRKKPSLRGKPAGGKSSRLAKPRSGR